ncbi:hypothetical protein IMG5_137140 [Ichthyophthirius multifiliis]|uniref:Uncharacterized protein n=1 Tax=Ichthyophthirius multifiliis TaxID=5932 RepID=G0QX16_ICHMU|nr:hypothetical protein IMG5_137140 [Ichthyophthirius multifiliis]EGR30239.1 hypothetical protein IMG5_137140 [Ichthyophthirius multifiliis]|eukprot:XP_004031835.1 hypothetical protein IMG5_137140 [Ichthyophthirius multifiliis]
MEFFEKHKTGELMSRLSRDISTAKAAVGFNTNMLLRNFFLIFSNLIMLFVISWKVSLAILPVVPAYYFVTKVYSSFSKKIEKKVSDISAVQSELTEEVFSGIMTVKSFGQENFEIKKYNQIISDEYAECLKSSIANALFFTIQNTFISNIGILIILWYGGSIVAEQTGDLSSGDLASFILYSTSLATNSSAISYGISSIVSAMGALERIFEMLNYEPIVKNNTGKNFTCVSGEIELKDVTFSYPKTNVEILHGVSSKIKAGECVAIVGASGSGKSTIVKLIERFYDVSSGGIFVNGENVKEINGLKLRQQIGLVSQEPTLFSGSLLDNIVYGIDEYCLDFIDKICDMAGVSEFLQNKNMFPKGYDTLVGERGTKLSGGQKQRVAIARALAKNPNILIFDEATSALDAESEYQVQQSIDKLVQNKSMTIIIIAHRLSTIKNSNKIIVMQYGIIVEEGNHQELIEKQGVYKSLIERQIQNTIQIN